MGSFENVSVVRAANVYFDGKVTSRTIRFSDGGEKTLGVMLPGEYRFNTDAKELMEIQQGDVSVRLENSDIWQEYHAGDSFEVPAKSAFDIKVSTIADYCCSFLK